MKRMQTFLLALLMLVWVVAPPSWARGKNPVQRIAEQLNEPSVDPIVNWINGLDFAAEAIQYSGTFVVKSGNTLRTNFIIHVIDGEGVKERMYTMDGDPVSFLRNNDVEHYLMPKDHRVVVRAPSTHFPSIMMGNPGDLSQYYTLKQEPNPSEVAGVPCTIYTLKAKTEDRNNFSFCVAPNQLVLRFERLSPQGQVLQDITFTNLQLGDKVDTSKLQSPYNTQSWTTIAFKPQSTTLSSAWRITPPPGFRVMDLIKGHDAQGNDVVQVVYTDGLSNFSLFLQKMTQAQAQMPGISQMQMGGQNIFRMRVDLYWVTAVGTLPMRTLQQIVRAVKYVPTAQP